MAQAMPVRGIPRPGPTLQRTALGSGLAEAIQALAHQFSQWGKAGRAKPDFSVTFSYFVSITFFILFFFFANSYLTKSKIYSGRVGLGFFYHLTQA